MNDRVYVPGTRTVEIGEVGDLTDADLARMSSDELTRTHVALGQALAAIKRQLRHADSRRQAGDRIDFSWRRTALNAKVMYEHQIRLVQAEFTRRRGGTKTERAVALQREFVNVAKEKLSEEVFRAWLDEAARRLRASGERADDAPARPTSDHRREQRIAEARAVASPGGDGTEAR